MWSDEVVPRLDALGLGAEVASRTLPAGRDRRVAGRRAARRADAAGDQPDRRDVRPRRGGRRADLAPSADDVAGADDLVETAATVVLERLGSYVWATGETTWSEAIGRRMQELGWTLAVVEIGTGGSIDALFGDAPWVRFDESIAPDAPAATRHGSGDVAAADEPTIRTTTTRSPMTSSASRGAPASSAAPRSGWPSARGRGPATPRCRSPSRRPTASVRVRRVVFLTGPMGRSRVALAAAAVLLEALRRGRRRAH